MNIRRVVITGYGAVSPLGNSAAALYDALKNGRSAIREMTEWKTGAFSDCRFFGSPVSLDQSIVKEIPRHYRRSMSPISIYAVLAAQEAVAHAGLTPDQISGMNIGCVIGSTMGGSSAIAETYQTLFSGGGFQNVSAMQFFKGFSHTAALNTAHYLNISGTVLAPCAACASALQAVGTARDLIANGTEDIVICGGAEELTAEVSGSFATLSAGLAALDFSPEHCSRPFDARRNGLICGEGAGLLVLEDLDHALARHAGIYGEVCGYATCCGSQIGQSEPESVLRCLGLAFRNAGISPSAADYINAHATSTLQGDAAEASALREFFGDSCPVSSLKGHLGHTLGASGAIELIASLQMMEHGEIIPTKNLEVPGEFCGGLDHVTGSIRQKEIRTFVKNSFAFGGINAAVICRKYND